MFLFDFSKLKMCDLDHSQALAPRADLVVNEDSMKKVEKFKSRFAASLALTFCVALMLGASQSNPGDESKSKKHDKSAHLISSVQGPDLFEAYCANCHGAQGKGNGEIASAEVLSAKVPDLTTLAKRNDGVFPGHHVRSIISGEELVKAHKSREMPLWGPIFGKGKKGHDLGSVRLENLTRYIESLQEK